MKPSKRLRLEASLGNNVYNPWPMVALREAADLLDECEKVIEEALRGDTSADWRMHSTLAKLRAQERG